MNAPHPSAQRLIRQIDRSLDGHAPSGEAFVASVYGEWGVGKTYCLRSVFDHYRQQFNRWLPEAGRCDRPKDLQPSFKLTVPVWFDAWRYEHETHLVVPLLKTIEATLEGAAQHIRATASVDEQIRAAGDVARNGLQKGADVTFRLAQCLLASVKLAVPGLLDIDPKAGIEMSQRMTKDATEATSKLNYWQRQDSLYFNADESLRELTVGDIHRAALRLVVLIDDLDRCLPEKAVQMLESVKLFLNVPGFCFILAVDDEVVERGIAHRYRDYQLADRNGSFVSDMPISGSQYLEKVIHLPVHLPRWTEQQARHFLQAEYGDLFAADAVRVAESTPPMHAVQPHSPQAPAVLDLVISAVPLVPRKLIRLAEGVRYLRDQFNDLGQTAAWQGLHALRVVALQQLYPRLYRYTRQDPTRYWRLFTMRRDSVWQEPTLRDSAGTVTREQLRQRRDAWRSSKGHRRGEPPTQASTFSLLEQLALMDCVHACAQERGAGDPLALFTLAEATDAPTAQDLGLADGEAFWCLYLMGESPPARTTPPAVAWDVSQPTANLPDAQASFEQLWNLDDIARRAFIEREHLTGQQLPQAVMRLLERVLQGDSSARSRVASLAWLRDMAKVTSGTQLLALYLAGDVVRYWTDPAALAKATPSITEQIAVLELLTCKLNPPHRPARALAELVDNPADLSRLQLPRGLRLRGAYLRGWPLNEPGESSAQADYFIKCDLRGTAYAQPQTQAHRLAPPLTSPWPGHAAAIQGLAFDVESNTLASACGARGIQFWAGQSDGNWSPAQMLSTGARCVYCVALGLQGAVVAAAADDGTVLIWTRNSGNVWSAPQALPGHAGPVNGVAFHPDGTLASAGSDQTVRLWAPQGDGTWAARQVLGGYGGRVRCVAFSRSGTTLAAADDDGTVQLSMLTEPDRWAPSQVLQGESGVHTVSFGHDDATLMSAGDERTIRLWTRHADGNWEAAHGLSGLAFMPRSAAYSRHGIALAAVCHDGIVRLWRRQPDASWGSPEVIEHLATPVRRVMFVDDDVTLALGDDSGRVLVWTSQSDGSSSHVTLGAQAHSTLRVTYMGEGDILACGGTTGVVHILDWRRHGVWCVSHVLAPALAGVSLFATNANGALLAADNTGRCQLWQRQDDGTWMALQAFDAGHGAATAITLNAHGDLVAIARTGYGVRLWRRQPSGLWKYLGALEGFSTDVVGVILTAHDATVITISRDGALQRFGRIEADGWIMCGTPAGNVGAVTCAVFHPQSQVLATGDTEGNVNVYAIQDEGIRATVLSDHRHHGQINAVTFSADGQWLGTLSGGHVIDLWTRLEGAWRHAHTRNVPTDTSAITINSDGTEVACGHRDGSVRIWSVQAHGLWQTKACLVGHGLDVLEVNTSPHTPHSCWQLRRTDGQPFETVTLEDGTLRLADPFAFEWLWFSGQTDEGRMVAYRAIDVPASWVEFAADCRTIWVQRRLRELPMPVSRPSN